MAEELSIAEAMTLLSVSKPTIYRLIRVGELHPIKKKIGLGIGGRRVFLDRKEVAALKDPGTAPQPAPVPSKHKKK